jgi:hypothetical protein
MTLKTAFDKTTGNWRGYTGRNLGRGINPFQKELALGRKSNDAGG